MIKINPDDTIAAISTPFGEGGIGIVRISGKDALGIADKIFVGKNGLKPSQFATFTVHYGFITEGKKRNGKNNIKGKVIDEVIINIMRAPRTYTKEDIVEINCHSGIVALRKVLELVINKGARLSQPGEFTQRAYLHGRIDLTQAEAVLDIINAKTDTALDSAIHQLQGAISQRINKLRETLIETIAPLEASIDFPEEDIELAEKKQFCRTLTNIAKQIKELIDSADRGILLQKGISVVIAGSPNVGKSSLMNKLITYERVIISPVSGTTRDVIEEVINIDGLAVRIADTAGIVDSKNLITKESVKRSTLFLEKADLVLFVLDACRRIDKMDIKVTDLLKNKMVLLVINKIDLKPKINLDPINKILPNRQVVKVSALTGLGIDRLKRKIANLFFRGQILKDDEVLINNIRHKHNLNNCYQNIMNGIKTIKEKGNDECVIFDVRQSLSELSEVVGEDLSEDILNNIFSRFCIGK